MSSQSFHLLERHLERECLSRLDIASSCVFIQQHTWSSHKSHPLSLQLLLGVFVLSCISQVSNGLIPRDSDGTNKKSQKASKKEITWRNGVKRFDKADLMVPINLDLIHWREKSMETFSSVQLSRSFVSDSLGPHELQHARLPCPSPSPGVHSNSCPSSW